MTSKEMLYKLYEKLYAQRAVLTAAPQLTIDIGQYDTENYPQPLVEKECAAIASYLCGVPDINDVSVNDVLKIIKKNYESQPFWKNVLLDFLDYKLKQKKEEQYKRNIELLKETTALLDQIRQEEYRRKMLINAFGDKIKGAGFRVDGYKLLQCYFVMYRKDAKKAYDTLITNPAFFSPIITVDSEGNVLLQPEEAIKENKRLAGFLKNLKI